MIDTCQWRASIGLWCLRQMPYNKETNSCNGRKESLLSRTSSARYHGCNMVLSIVVFLSFLLILSGDVELNPGPRTVIPGILKLAPTRHDLLRLLSSISYKWYELGVGLRVSFSTLQGLQFTSMSNVDKVSLILQSWMDNTESHLITWKTIISVIEGPLIENISLAEQIYDYLTKDVDKLLLQAMKEGYVTVKWTKLTLSGPPGTGKSSLLRLLLNQPPLEEHNSTPVIATPEIRIVETSDASENSEGATVDITSNECKELEQSSVKTSTFMTGTETSGQCTSWKNMDSNSLRVLIAQGIRNGVRTSEIPLKYDEEIPPPPDMLEAIEVVDDDSDELYRIHWIYAVDTGGQAAFLDIAPALLRYNSVNIITHKLTEELRDYPEFKYYVQGVPIGGPVKHRISNLQLLESSLRLVAQTKPVMFDKIVTTPSHRKPQSIVLGTFYDQLDNPVNSLQEKNKVLWPIIDHQFSDTVVPYKVKEKDSEVIFPINTMARDKKEKQMANRLRNRICQSFIEAEIPARWFLFQLDLDKLEQTSGTKIVSFNECKRIGKNLSMNPDEVKAALMYYHNLTIFLYFPDILPNVVFLHPQPLFDRLSDLISISFADVFNHLEEINIFIDYEQHKLLKTEGIFKEYLLTQQISKGFSEIFTANDFLKLMGYLHIIAALPESGQYFLPAVLPFSDLSSDRDSLILTWDMKPLPRGLFCTLVVQLLQLDCMPLASRIKFKIEQTIEPKSQQYRNALTLTCIGEPGNVLLIDSIHSIEIYYSGPRDRRNRVCTTIVTLIVKELQQPIPQYIFHCFCSSDELHHYCRVDEKKEYVTCCGRGEKPTSHLTPGQQAWFADIKSSSNILKDIPDSYDLLRQLVDINNQWRVIGLALRISENDLDGLDGKPTEKLSKVINIWKTSGNQELITWDTVISAIEGSIVNNKQKANEIRAYLGLTI